MSLAGALLALVALAPGAGAQMAEVARRFHELVAPGAPGAEAERGRALAALGVEAGALLVAELEARPRDEVLRHAVRGFGRAALERWWRDGSAGARARLVLLAELGSRHELALALAPAGAHPDLGVEALRAILERDPAGLPPLAATVLTLDAPTATVLVRAVGGLGTSASLDWLGALLAFGKDELELCTLSAIAAGAARAGAGDEARHEVRERLWSDDEQVLRKAIDACARLQDDESLERLIALLDHPTGFVSSTALGALRTLAGRSFPHDPVAWRRWLARESARYAARAAVAGATLRVGRREHALAAARELAEFRVERRGVLRELLPLLDRDDPGLRRAGCEALGELGLRDALAELREALDDESDEVVRAAARALGRLGQPVELPARAAPPADE